MRKIIYLFALLIPSSLFAQNIIEGTVYNSKQEKLNAVNVTLYQVKNPIIFGYSITNNEGKYKLIINTNSDSIEILVTSIGFSSIKKTIKNSSQELNFILSPEAFVLPNVIVKSVPPITKRGDTLNYDVKSFITKSDRVISDVIKNLPGIEVTDNGQIKYNGKPITNYYIEGLDLLENRYNIANQNLPANLVDKVQILENHQPIKALDSSTFTDRAALNIKLKSNAKNKVFFNSKIGVGFSPFLWEGEILAFNFRKKIQTISGYKTNNIGINLSNEITELNTTQFDKLAFQYKKEDILSIVNKNPPPFEIKKYLFNNSHLFYTNGLFLINPSAQLKYNIILQKEKIIATTATNSFFVNPTNTITFDETQQQIKDNNNILTNFSYSLNKTNLFIKNNLKIEGYFNSEVGTIRGNSVLIQNLKNPMFQVINNFHLICSKKKTKFEINSNTILKKLPQTLSITPGVFSSLLNQGQSYLSLEQATNLFTFNTDNYLSKKFHILNFYQNFKIGFNYEKSNLKSQIEKDGNSLTQLILNDTFKNNLNWAEFKPYTEIGFFCIKRGYNFSFLSTLLNNTLIRKDSIQNIDKITTNIFFNNSISVRKDLGNYYNLTLAYNNDNKYNSINQNTLGFIFGTYRNLYKNDFTLQLNKTYSTSLFLKYNNAIKAKFGYLSLFYLLTQKNTLNNITFTNQFETKNAILFANKNPSILSMFYFSKYYKKTKSGFSVNASSNYSNYLNIQQNVLQKIISNTSSITFNFRNNLSRWIYPEIGTTISYYTNKISFQNSNISLPKVLQIKQNVKLTYFLSEKIIFYTSGSLIHFNSKNYLKSSYLFLDGGGSLALKKVYLDLKFSNILNNKYFTALNSSSNSIEKTEYQLRPFNALLQLNFRF